MKDETYLTAEEIVDSFLKYLDNSIYDYAFMLDGSWGSGKTYFVKEILIPAIQQHEEKRRESNPDYKERKVLYVTLYGIQDTEEISRLLYIELRKILTDRLPDEKLPEAVKVKKDRITSWIGTGAKILADVVKDAKGIDVENIFNRFSTGFSLENCIFIFDDLERTGCNINDILGYINHFVEHDKTKVLLIANEEEINTVASLDTNPDELMVCLQDTLDFGDSDKNDSNADLYLRRGEEKKNTRISIEQLKKRVEQLFTRNRAYKQIKEKVVGETVKYKPVYEDMIRTLTETHLGNMPELKTMVLNRISRIDEVAGHYNHQNLRTYLFFLSKMVMIYECLSEHSAVLENLIDYIFLVSLKCKTGRSLEKWEEGTEFGQRSVYEWYDFWNNCLGFRFIDEYILYGKFDTKKIQSIVCDYEEVQKRSSENQNDPAGKLNAWSGMSEEELKEILSQVLEKMRSGGYDFSLYLQILKSFTAIVSIGFEERYLSELMQYMKENIRQAEKKIDLDRMTSAFYNERDRTLYSAAAAEIRAAADEREKNAKEEELKALLADVNVWGKKFSEYVYEHRGRANNEFMHMMDTERILQLIDDGSSDNIETFRYALEEFYNFSNIADFYKEDYRNLKCLYDGLDPEKETYDLIKKQNVRWLMGTLKRKLDLLAPVS